jgi:hypothetical protein
MFDVALRVSASYLSPRVSPRKNDKDGGAADRPAGRMVPSSWLLAQSLLLLIACAASLLALLRGSNAPRDGQPAPRADRPTGVTLGGVGPWGQLETAPIVISPPLEYIPEDPDPPQRLRWHFANASPAEVEAFLREAGVPAAACARLLGGAAAERSGVTLSPDRETLLSLSADARARVYMRLAESPQNQRHQNAFRFFGPPEVWLAGTPLTPATLEKVRPLLYGAAGFSYFADIDLLRSDLGDAAELRLLTKKLFREATLAVRVRLPAGTSVDAAAEYWGRGGRRTDIRPLLESVAAVGPDYAVDIAHLLPPFARQHLYRYPQIALRDFDKPSLANCFWTALNFFSKTPDDRMLDFAAVLAALKRDYALVHDSFQLGDVVMFEAEDGRYYHAAVYLADGLVFGKNGSSSLSPWTILPLERLRGYYPQHPRGRTSYYRRVDLY